MADAVNVFPPGQRITDTDGVVHAMASLRERAELYRSSSIAAGLQVTRERIFDSGSRVWPTWVQLALGQISLDFASKAQALAARDMEATGERQGR